MALSERQREWLVHVEAWVMSELNLGERWRLLTQNYNTLVSLWASVTSLCWPTWTCPEKVESVLCGG